MTEHFAAVATKPVSCQPCQNAKPKGSIGAPMVFIGEASEKIPRFGSLPNTPNFRVPAPGVISQLLDYSRNSQKGAINSQCTEKPSYGASGNKVVEHPNGLNKN